MITPEMLTDQYRKGLALLLAFLFVYFAGEIALNLTRPYWGDEAHFGATVRLFADQPTLDTLQHYNEMSPPLPFILYAVWGRFFGMGTPALRIFSIALASITWVTLYHLIFWTIGDVRAALLTTAFIAINPYMVAFSIFVFTDMAAIACLVLACIAIKDRRPILFLISSSAALLSRQYMVFLSVGAIAYFLARWIWLDGEDRANARQMLIAAAISFLPLLILFGLWRGPNPDNADQHLYAGENFRFHPNSLTLYIALLCIYLFPFVVLNLRRFFKNRSTWVVALIGVAYYQFFPVQPSQVSLDADINTVGIFHRAIRFLIGEPYEQWIFFISFLVGLGVSVAVFMDIYLRWRRRDLGMQFFLGLAILSFLTIMPFSYLGWEKYFLPEIPITAMWILATCNRHSTNVSSAPLESTVP